MITVKIDIKEMIHNVINANSDILCDAAISGDFNSVSYYGNSLIDTLRTLSNENNIENIRKLFKDGMSAILLGSEFKSIELNDDITMTKDEVEIRVYSDNKLLGVIIDSEIVY